LELTLPDSSFLLDDELLPTTGADLSLVTVFFNLAPFSIELSNALLPPPPDEEEKDSLGGRGGGYDEDGDIAIFMPLSTNNKIK